LLIYLLFGCSRLSLLRVIFGAHFNAKNLHTAVAATGACAVWNIYDNGHSTGPISVIFGSGIL